MMRRRRLAGFPCGRSWRAGRSNLRGRSPRNVERATVWERRRKPVLQVARPPLAAELAVTTRRSAPGNGKKG